MTSSPENKITRSDLVKSAVNVGALGMEFSWTYYKQMNIAFCLMVANMLKKIYAGRPDDYAAALHRHCAFFNITVQFAPFVGGIAMAMEEKVARGEIEPESVNDVKAALMGPLSGIGDSIFLSRTPACAGRSPPTSPVTTTPPRLPPRHARITPRCSTTRCSATARTSTRSTSRPRPTRPTPTWHRVRPRSSSGAS